MNHGRVPVFEEMNPIYDLALLPDSTRRVSPHFLSDEEFFN